MADEPAFHLAHAGGGIDQIRIQFAAVVAKTLDLGARAGPHCSAGPFLLVAGGLKFPFPRLQNVVVARWVSTAVFADSERRCSCAKTAPVPPNGGSQKGCPGG